MKIFILITFISLFSFSSVIGQEKKANNVQRTYYYSFNEVSSIEQIEKLKADIETLKSVVKVKTEYKVEKNAGQVIVVVVEPKMTFERQVLFSPLDLKKLIIKNNLMPHELSQEEVELNK